MMLIRNIIIGSTARDEPQPFPIGGLIIIIGIICDQRIGVLETIT